MTDLESEVLKERLLEIVYHHYPGTPNYDARQSVERALKGRILNADIPEDNKARGILASWVRHDYTNYVRLLNEGGLPVAEAREEVKPFVDEILARWKDQPVPRLRIATRFTH